MQKITLYFSYNEEDPHFIKFHRSVSTNITKETFFNIQTFLKPMEKDYNNYEESPNGLNPTKGVFHNYSVSAAEMCCIQHIVNKDFLQN